MTEQEEYHELNDKTGGTGNLNNRKDGSDEFS